MVIYEVQPNKIFDAGVRDGINQWPSTSPAPLIVTMNGKLIDRRMLNTSSGVMRATIEP